MRHSFRKASVFLSTFVALIVMLSAIPVSFAASTTTADAVNKKVYISGASYVQLIDANIIPSSSGATASFTFTFYNGDSKDLVLNDYWARLNSTGGTKYTLTLLDQAKKRIAPKASATLTFYSQVGAKMTLDQLVVNIIKFDFSVAGYERSVAKYTFPKGYTNFIKAGGFKKIQINNSSINVRVDKINVTKKDKNYDFNLSYVARNTSQFGVALPTYNYYVQTSAGLYKLNLKNKTDETLLLEPAVLNAVRLTGSIPSTLATTGWKLVITNNAGSETSKIELPVATFDIPFKLSTVSTGTATTTFTNDFGTYDVELKNVQRSPWGTKDQVIAEMVIYNKESVYLPLPTLNGQFIVDDNITLSSKQLNGVDEIGLAPGTSTVINFIGEITANYSWKKFKLQLNKGTGEDVTTLAELTKSAITAMPVIKAGQVYTPSNVGSKFTAVINNVASYKGEETDLFAVYVDVTNTQTRNNILPNWVAYFKTVEGNYYEAKVVKANKTIKPTNKEQVLVYADLPPYVNRDGMKLMIGEAFDDNGMLKAEGAAKGYLRAVQLELPAEKTDLSSFKQIKVGPYMVDMSYFTAFMFENNLAIDMGAAVTKDRSYDDFKSNKLMIALEKDATNEIIFTHTIDLETKTDAGTLWKLGNNFSQVKKDMSDVSVFDDYTLNLYELLDGNKKKLASVDIKWSNYVNWLEDKK